MHEQSTEADDKRRGGQRFSSDTIKEFLEFSPDLTCLCHGETIDLINSAGLRLLRRDKSEEVEGRKFSEFIKPEYSDNQGNFVYLLHDENEPFPVKLTGSENSEINAEITVSWARELGKDTVILRAHDISDLVHLSGDLMRSESRFRRLVDNALDMICTCENGTITFINKSGVDLLGAKNTNEIIGLGIENLFHPDYHQIFTESIDELVRENCMFPARLACRDGTYLDVQIMASRSTEQAPSRYMVEVRDITEHRNAVMALHQSKMELEERVRERTRELTEEVKMRIEVEEKLRHLATHDPLTGLPNRNLLMDRLSTVLAQAKRAETSTALAFIDLDGFKAVNDTQGHEAGDILLMEAAQRLLGCIRESDTLARIGGDEFIVSFFAVAERKSVPSMAEKILKSLNRAFDINGQKVRISASIGISFYPDDGATPDTLMKSADQAMYEVKEAGKNGIAMAGGVKA